MFEELTKVIKSFRHICSRAYCACAMTGLRASLTKLFRGWTPRACASVSVWVTAPWRGVDADARVRASELCDLSPPFREHMHELWLRTP